MSRFSVATLWLVIFGLLWFAYLDWQEVTKWTLPPPVVRDATMDEEVAALDSVYWHGKGMDYVSFDEMTQVETLPPPVVRDATAAEEKALLENTCMHINLNGREYGIAFTVPIFRGETCVTILGAPGDQP